MPIKCYIYKMRHMDAIPIPTAFYILTIIQSPHSVATVTAMLYVLMVCVATSCGLFDDHSPTCAQMRAGAFKCKCQRRFKCKCKCKCNASESSASANAQQLNQMQIQMQMHLYQIQMHLDQMQMLFYNYVFFCVQQVIFCSII